MTRANFDAVMVHVFREEGGYVDHPKDPGGATNLGITFAVLQEWRGEPITKADVKALTKAEATAIYKARYWDKIKGDDLPAGIDLLTMDGAVNSGPSQGAKWLQRAVGVADDGKIGPATLLAVSQANPATVINNACDQRLAFLKKLKTWPTFGKGWQARVDRVRKEALAMAKVPVTIQPIPDLGPRLPPDAPVIVEPYIPKPATKAPRGVLVTISLAALAAVVYFIAKQIGVVP